MKDTTLFDVIIVGGSYAGLAAALALGRALKRVLVIDSGLPCNRQTPYSHNFLTQDGQTPQHITTLAKQQVNSYKTVTFFNGLATKALKTESGFILQVASGESFRANKVLFTTGIRDILPAIPGLAACWGISVLHCPYCHGYEVKDETKAILGNGDYGFELVQLISNWTRKLTLFTNGASTLTPEQANKLAKRSIQIVPKEIARLEHTDGRLQNIVFQDGTKSSAKAAYVRSAFEQHCPIPEALGCELTAEGYLQVDALGETTVSGIYAAGDNVTRMRTVANAVAMGTSAGMMISKKMIFECF